MEIIHNLAFGFEHALTLHNLMYCAIGCMVGTLVGLLPGLGPLSTISLLLPLTYSIPTGGALIMLAGIYYGAQYGDSVSAITMKIPHASSIVACIDGYQMTLNGKTGLALFSAGVSSFIGGTVAIVVLSTLAPLLGELAFLFGPADYCALMLLGFLCVSFVTTGGHMLNGLAMALIGVLLGTIGTDVNSGAQRFTFDQPFLADGVGLISVALGCFGIAEIVKNLDNRSQFTPFSGNIHLLPSWAEFKRIIPSALRGSAVGSFLGLLPGGGPTLAQFGAYALEKRFSKHREEIGKGAIEGVAGQAAADEAAARTSFIPLMSIGIPENAVMALMLAAFIVKGIQPGPNMIGQHPELFWGLVASMWIGNCFLLILNVPMVRYLLSVFKIPYAALFPAILFFCCIGTFSVNNNLDDIYITAVFGVLGYIFLRLDLEPAPLILGFILGPMLEENF
ncbi:MAG TPA: tripartite tricarboxylate transporter permease, partial [Chloroflexota bacterium]|nr:tripartite tricarboxylate transporter permease [Chloroflexota bacterium]